jgi:hypothetical protein
MSRKREPSVADGYNEWREKVIGSNRLADPNHAVAGTYGYFEYKAKRFDLTVKAHVYPFVGVTDENGPHAWGVVFPKQDRTTRYDPRTDEAKEVRPYAPEKRFGSHAPTREQAMKDAVECIARGGWDAIERNDNGTITALDAWDDVPEGE